MVRRNLKDGNWHRKFILCAKLRIRAHGSHRTSARRIWFTTVERRWLGSGVWLYREAETPPPTGLPDEPGWFTNAQGMLAVYGCGGCVIIFIVLGIIGALSLIARAW